MGSRTESGSATLKKDGGETVRGSSARKVSSGGAVEQGVGNIAGKDSVGKSSGVRRTKTQANPVSRRGHVRTDSNMLVPPSGRQHANTISVVASSKVDGIGAVARSRPSVKNLAQLKDGPTKEVCVFFVCV